MSSEMSEVPEMKPEIERVVKTWGGLGDKVGEGFFKTAYNVGENKVLVIHKEIEIPGAVKLEYIKAEYYLNKILHALMPDNFVNVRMVGGGNALLVDKIPDNDDFVKAKEILKKGYYPNWTKEEAKWMGDKRFEMSIRPEFKRVMSVIEEIMITFGDNGDSELSGPTNTVMVGDHPVVVDVMRPLEGVLPTLDEVRFKKFMERKIASKEIGDFEAKKILSFYGRYKENVEKCINALPQPEWKNIMKNYWSEI